jgi:hypothetical protein
MEVQLHHSCSWHKVEVSGQLHTLDAVPLVKAPPSTHWIGWVGPKIGLDAVEKRKISCPYQQSNLAQPAHSLLLYQLSYFHSVYELSC